MNGKSYEDGIVEGKVQALEQITAKHEKRLDRHSMRISKFEKIVYGMAGMILLLQFLPTIKAAIGG